MPSPARNPKGPPNASLRVTLQRYVDTAGHRAAPGRHLSSPRDRAATPREALAFATTQARIESTAPVWNEPLHLSVLLPPSSSSTPGRAQEVHVESALFELLDTPPASAASDAKPSVLASFELPLHYLIPFNSYTVEVECGDPGPDGRAPTTIACTVEMHDHSIAYVKRTLLPLLLLLLLRLRYCCARHDCTPGSQLTNSPPPPLLSLLSGTST